MPLSKDKRGGGTNADGSKSTMYCSYCFDNGQFLLPDLTVKQMQKRIADKLKQLGFPGFITWFFTRKIPKLVRWQQK